MANSKPEIPILYLIPDESPAGNTDIETRMLFASRHHSITNAKKSLINNNKSSQKYTLSELKHYTNKFDVGDVVTFIDNSYIRNCRLNVIHNIKDDYRGLKGTVVKVDKFDILENWSNCACFDTVVEFSDGSLVWCCSLVNIVKVD